MNFVMWAEFKLNLGLGQTSNLSRVEFIKNRFDKEST